MSGFSLIFTVAFFAFQIWMLVDAIRRQEWLWAVFIGLGLAGVLMGISAILYFFMVYRRQAAFATGGMKFEMPGSYDRRRIKELQSQIHHLDKPHHHLELGEIYRRQGKDEEAGKCFEAAYERDPEDADIQAQLGAFLVEKEPDRAIELLSKVCRQKPDHDYGSTMIALADALAKAKREPEAIERLRQVVDQHSYASARVKLATLLTSAGKPGEALPFLREAVADHDHAPSFAKGQEKRWVNRAKKLLKDIESGDAK